jgi:probable HAF family extracellular repeat protein
MMKTSKGILVLFLVVAIAFSGVALCDDSGDLLDFLPAFAKRARFGNAVAKPFFIVPGVSTPVTITAYIPDADLVADSVQLKDGTAIIGNLSDTGNKVFSITSNFQRDSGGAIKLSISAIFGPVSKTIAQFEIPVLSLPTLQDASQYNQNVDNIFATLVAARDNFTVLKDPSTPATQFSTHLSTAKDRLLSVYANMEAIYRAETHSPSNYPRWASFIPTFGGACQNLVDIDQKKQIFIDNPNDPRVADILAYAEWPWDISTRAGRKSVADYYYSSGPGLQSTLQQVNKIAEKQLGGQFTGLAGGAIGQIYVGGWTGWLTGLGINEGVGKIIDIFITNDNQMGMLVAEVQNGEAVQLPAGSHDILFSFKGVLDRAIYRNVMVNPNLTTTINVAPGEVKLCKYSYQDLGHLGGSYAYPSEINNSGQIVGNSITTTGDEHAFLWTASSGMQDLGTLGGNFARSRAIGINSSGQIVGVSTNSTGAEHAFLWTASSGMQNLGTLGGNLAAAFAISSSGQIVGCSATSTGVLHAFLWTASSGMEDLGTLGGGGIICRLYQQQWPNRRALNHQHWCRTCLFMDCIHWNAGSRHLGRERSICHLYQQQWPNRRVLNHQHWCRTCLFMDCIQWNGGSRHLGGL